MEIKKYNTKTNIKEFVEVYNIHNDCPISNWWLRYADKTIGEVLDEFLNLSERDATFARITHWHVSFLLTQDIRQKFVDIVLTDPVQAALMWAGDQTITEQQSQELFNIFMDPNTGATEYAKAYELKEFQQKEINQKYNLDSDITMAYLNKINLKPEE